MKSKLLGDVIGGNIPDASFQMPTSPLTSRVIGHTNIGPSRAKNQDAASVFYSKEKDQIWLSIADGLGSYRYSERSAYEAVMRIPHLLQDLSMKEAFEQFHRILLTGFPYSPNLKGQKTANTMGERDMGATTCVVAEICGNKMRVGNVGDSRCYVLREGKIFFQTRDQSMVELLVSEGRIKREDLLASHPLRSVLLNALGSPEPEYQFEEEGRMVVFRTGLPIIHNVVLQKGDWVLLVTDGFFTNLSEEEIRGFQKLNWDKLRETLVRRLNEIQDSDHTQEGIPSNPDNYTFLIYRYEQ